MHTRESLIAFELRIKAHWESGVVPAMTHLCGGNEDQLLALFREIRADDWVYSSHRAHYHALLKGVPEATVEAEILAGRSMFLFSAEHRFLSTAVLAGQCGIAAGLALEIKRSFDLSDQSDRSPRVWCFLGDGAEEEGHFYEAALFVEAHDLPCTFIIEDNGWQMDTSKEERRPMNHDYTHGPLDHFSCVKRYHYERTYPHAGSGAKPGTITWNPEAVERLRPQTV
jgi:TPP-dependent pyruvate/acetoin dehydrogenase alpha subunit